MAKKRISYLLLPPYSPELNAIEKVWALHKRHWRKAITKARAAFRATPVMTTAIRALYSVSDETVKRIALAGERVFRELIKTEKVE